MFFFDLQSHIDVAQLGGWGISFHLHLPVRHGRINLVSGGRSPARQFRSGAVFRSSKVYQMSINHRRTVLRKVCPSSSRAGCAWRQVRQTGRTISRPENLSHCGRTVNRERHVSNEWLSCSLSKSIGLYTRCSLPTRTRCR